MGRGHDVRALAFTRGSPTSRPHDGVPLDRLRARLHIGNAPIDPAFAGRVGRTIRAFAPDVVWAHTPVPFPAEMAYLAAHRAEVPFVVTYHAGRLRGSSVSLDQLAAIDRATLERRMLDGAARLMAVSPFVRDHALARQRERVTIVPPGVDAARFSPNGLPEGPTVLFVGPLASTYRWKGIDVLLEAFPRVLAHVPRARLTLVGDGDRVPEFAAKAAALGYVRLAGRVSDEGLVAEYRRAAVVALPSVTEAESFGMVLAEANACGRPVVASRIGGIPDFVRPGDNGLLAPPGQPAGLAEQLVKVLTDASLAHRLGQQGRDRVLREHDWERLTIDAERVLDDAGRASGRVEVPTAPSPAGRGSIH